jgi:hypothetical protein
MCGCLIVVVLMLAAGGMLTVWSRRPGWLSETNYERIRVDMSRQQVAELLGSPGEISKSIPHWPRYVHEPGYPPGWTGVVWGDTFVY